MMCKMVHSPSKLRGGGYNQCKSEVTGEVTFIIVPSDILFQFT